MTCPREQGHTVPELMHSMHRYALGPRYLKDTNYGPRTKKVWLTGILVVDKTCPDEELVELTRNVSQYRTRVYGKYPARET